MATTGGGVESPDHPIVGRESELDQLRTLLAASSAGPLRGVIVEGEAGVGKSVLLRQIQAHARASGFRVLVGTAAELERNLAFGVIFEMARGQLREESHSAVFEELLKLGSAGGPQAADGGFAVTEELVAALEACAAEAPVLLCLDDLHWADSSTVAAVGAIVRRLAGLPLLVIVTLRPTPRSRKVGQLIDQLGSAGAVALRLAPLPEDAAVGLAKEILGVPPGPLLREQISATAGNPLFVVELLRTLRQQDLISLTPDGAEIARRVVPASLREILLRRYGFLAEPTLRLLRMASILGRSFAVNELAVVCQSRPTQLMAQLDEAIAAGLIAESGDSMTFHHDLFRQVLYESMPNALRIALHREAGAALAEAGAPVVRVAEQFYSGDPRGAQTTEWLWRAARESARRSTSLAVRWYQRALNAVDATDPQRVTLISELVPQLVLRGRIEEAQLAAAQAIEHAEEPAIAVRLRVVLAHALTRQGLWRSAREQLELGAAQYHDPTTVAVVSAPESFLRLITGEAGAAVALAERSEAAAKATRNDLAAATCLMTRTLGAAATGAVDEAITLGRQCLALTDRLRSSFREFLLPELCLGVALTDADRPAEAERYYREGLDRATRVGAAGVLPYLQANLAILRMHTGAWTDAGSEAEACLELVASTGTRWTAHVRAIQARLAISRHDFPAAHRILADAEAELAASGHIMGANWVLWAKALLLEAEDRPAEAADVARKAWDVLPELRFLHSNWMFPADVLRLVLGAGDRATADAIVADTAAAAERVGTASATGAALRCRALFSGDPQIALEAVAAYQASHRKVELALAQAEAADALADTGHPDRAREHFRAAADTFAALGLTREENRIDATMRSHAIHRGRRRSRRPSVGWNSLTPTELSVARLVGQGLSNPQIAASLFISRYTVETHLKHVFSKLGITSRVVLANELIRRSLGV
ncbi:MAG TPA: AAA family ATPase [Actinophytocola sp.]|uniref:helix-turn-helix transcriptional regulator n=1 Tax=Actinophytocola sp. TaxID=1872138 RepID=UPI002DBD6CCC|nr:AAA family ATPase [Actinophytocola sp.]HEU5469140.1 AAA family ATPase [Actinophytocola sp.]